MNKNGYTAIELLILFAVIGIIAIVSINRVTYAFASKDGISLRENAFLIIEAEAKKYGEKNPDIFKKENEYYMNVNDLIEAGYLLKGNEKTILGFDDLYEKKIKISKDDKSITAVVLNRE